MAILLKLKISCKLGVRWEAFFSEGPMLVSMPFVSIGNIRLVFNTWLSWCWVCAPCHPEGTTYDQNRGSLFIEGSYKVHTLIFCRLWWSTSLSSREGRLYPCLPNANPCFGFVPSTWTLHVACQRAESLFVQDSAVHVLSTRTKQTAWLTADSGKHADEWTKHALWTGH